MNLTIKKCLFVAFCFLVFWGLVAVGQAKQQSCYANFSKIDFPQIGEELSSKVNYHLDPSMSFSNEKIKNAKPEDFLFSFTAPPLKEQKLTKLKEIFALENLKSLQSMKAVVYQNESHLLRINDDGTFVYRNKNRDDNTSMKLSDEKTKSIAKDFLIKNDLLPPGFFENGISYETVTNALNPQDSKILRKEVYFNRKINDKLVYGISRIIVSINQTGDIDAVYSAYKDYSNEEKIKIISFDQAFEKLKDLKGMINMDATTTDVTLKKVELVYWEDSSPNSKQTHIQPVYHFLGDSKNTKGEKGLFEGFVAAVSDNLTTSEEQPQIKSTPKTSSESTKEKPEKREKPENLR